MNFAYFTQIQRDVNNVYKNVLYKYLKEMAFFTFQITMICRSRLFI